MEAFLPEGCFSDKMFTGAANRYSVSARNTQDSGPDRLIENEGWCGIRGMKVKTGDYKS